MSTTHDHDAHEAHGPEQPQPTAAECADFLEQIVYFIDNELDAADCSVVKQHLDTCNPCLAKYDLQRTVKEVVARSCSEAAPTELRSRIMLRLQQVRIQVNEG